MNILQEQINNKVAKLQDNLKHWDGIIEEKRKQLKIDTQMLNLVERERNRIWVELINTQQDPVWKEQFIGDDPIAEKRLISYGPSRSKDGQ